MINGASRREFLGTLAAFSLFPREQEKPDLILSDVMMPGLDGFGLLTSLRRDEVLRELPIILLSARAGEEARVEGLDAGADDYVNKPFSARDSESPESVAKCYSRSLRQGCSRPSIHHRCFANPTRNRANANTSISLPICALQ